LVVNLSYRMSLIPKGCPFQNGGECRFFKRLPKKPDRCRCRPGSSGSTLPRAPW
jgi:hypothetical protein